MGPTRVAALSTAPQYVDLLNINGNEGR